MVMVGGLVFGVEAGGDGLVVVIVVVIPKKRFDLVGQTLDPLVSLVFQFLLGRGRRLTNRTGRQFLVGQVPMAR